MKGKQHHILILSRSNFARPGSPDPGQRRGFDNPLGAILDLLILGVVLVALIWPAVALAQGPDLDRVNRLLRTTDFMDGLPRGWKSAPEDLECSSGWRCYDVMGPGGTKYYVELPDHVIEGPSGVACLYCTLKSCQEDDCDPSEFYYDVGFDPKGVKPSFGSPCTEPDDEYYHGIDNWFSDQGYTDEVSEGLGDRQNQVLSGMSIQWAHDFGQGRYAPVNIGTGTVGIEIRLCSEPLADLDETQRQILVLAELVKNKLDGIASGSASGAAGWSELPLWVPIFAGLLGAGGALFFGLFSGLFGPLPAGGAVQPQPGLQPRSQPMPQPQPRPQPQPEQLRAQQQERVKKVLDKLDNQANQCYASAQPIRASLEARVQAARDHLVNARAMRDQAGLQGPAGKQALEQAEQAYKRALRKAEEAQDAVLDQVWKDYDAVLEQLREQHGDWVSDVSQQVQLWAHSPETLNETKERLRQKAEASLEAAEQKLADLKTAQVDATDQTERVFDLRRRVALVSEICDRLYDKGPGLARRVAKEHEPERAPEVLDAAAHIDEAHTVLEEQAGQVTDAEKKARETLRELEKLYDDNVGWLNDRKADYDQARQALQQFVQQASPLDPGFNATVQELRQKATSAARRVCEASSYMVEEIERSPAYLRDVSGQPYEGYEQDLGDLRQARDNYHRRVGDLDSYLRHHGPGKDTYDPATERKMRDLVDDAKKLVEMAEDRIRRQGGVVPRDEGPERDYDPYAHLDVETPMDDAYWQGIDSMLDDAKQRIRDAKKRAIMDDWDEAEFKDYMAEAWEDAVYRTEWIKWGCDRAIDFTATMAGAPGANLKRLYVFTTKFFEGYFGAEDYFKRDTSGALAGGYGLAKGTWNVVMGEMLDYLSSFDKVRFLRQYDSMDMSDWNVGSIVKNVFSKTVDQFRQQLVREGVKSAAWNTLQAQVQDNVLGWLGITTPEPTDFLPDTFGEDQMTRIMGAIDERLDPDNLERILREGE